MNMSPDPQSDEITTAAALQEWRAAERTVAVAKRGRMAAEAAVLAANEAAEAAISTAEAAKAALVSAKLAETSATKTANAARTVIRTASEYLVDAENDQELSEAEEVAAHDRYQRAALDASRRTSRP
jgi:hypothetical protein